MSSRPRANARDLLYASQIGKHIHLLLELLHNLLVDIHARGDAGHVVHQNAGISGGPGDTGGGAVDGAGDAGDGAAL